MTLSQKKEKKDMAFCSKKRFRIAVIPLLVQRISKVKAFPRVCSGHLINVGLFGSNDEGDIFPEKGQQDTCHS